MNKPLLTFAALSVLTVAHPGSGVAAPGAGSTEQADRRFLAHLEASDAAPPDVNESAPAPATPTANPPFHTKPAQIRISAPSKKTAVVAKGPRVVLRLPPGEVADDELMPLPATSATTVAIVPTRESDHDHDRGEDRGFFHRLFGRLLSKHPEDW